MQQNLPEKNNILHQTKSYSMEKIMFTTFSNAPSGILLHLDKIEDKKLESDLFRMGIHSGNTVYKMDAESDMHTVRIKTAKGERVLAGGMGGKIVAHLEDNRIIPLTEMKPKEKAHIEAIEGGVELNEAFQALGLNNGEEFELVRSLPPMVYVTEIKGKKRIKLSEGMAAKIIGKMKKKGECQFANAGAKVPFTVSKIIGGKSSRKIMDSLNIQENDVLTLISVENAPIYCMSKSEKFMMVTDEGLRVVLKKEQSDNIKVTPLSVEACLKS